MAKKPPHDNNKRLAELEAAEAARLAAANAPERGPRDEYPFAYENGKRARAANIPLDQAPAFFNDTERAAYEEGYGSEESDG